MVNKLAKITEELGKIFQQFNDAKFNGELQTAVITIQSGVKEKALGWCSVGHRWSTTDTKEGFHEINISAEYIGRSVEDICETLLHEMIHLYNQQHGINDCSKQTGIHLQRFKEACEKFGLGVEKDHRGGWSMTFLTDELTELIQTFKIDRDVFNVERIVEQKVTKTAQRVKMIKMECGCGCEIKCKEPVKAVCQICGEEFVEL